MQIQLPLHLMRRITQVQLGEQFFVNLTRFLVRVVSYRYRLLQFYPHLILVIVVLIMPSPQLWYNLQWLEQHLSSFQHNLYQIVYLMHLQQLDQHYPLPTVYQQHELDLIPHQGNILINFYLNPRTSFEHPGRLLLSHYQTDTQPCQPMLLDLWFWHPSREHLHLLIFVLYLLRLRYLQLSVMPRLVGIDEQHIVPRQWLDLELLVAHRQITLLTWLVYPVPAYMLELILPPQPHLAAQHDRFVVDILRN